MSDKLMTGAMTAAQALVELLRQYQVQYIFGVCGDTSLPYYDALQQGGHGITHVLARDERSAAYMADAYARVSGKVGVCEGPSGGGATYLAPGLVEANESSVPVIGITSDVAVSSRGRFPLTELDQQALYAPLTKWNGSIDTPAQLGDCVRQAFRAATSGRPGAAHLCFPYDVQKLAVDPASIWAQADHVSAPAWRSAPEPAAVLRASQALTSAAQVVIIAGGGVVGAGATAELRELAEYLSAPVCTTVTGKGAIADNHPLAAGVIGSNGAVIATRELIAAADLVLLVACRAGSTTTEHWKFPKPGVRVVHIDVDAMTIGANYPTQVALVGDAKLALAALLTALRSPVTRVDQAQGNISSAGPSAGPSARIQAPRASKGQALVARARDIKLAAFEALAASHDTPIKPERIVKALRKALPADSIVCADPGTPCPYLAAYFDLPDAGRGFITNRAHGALGYSLPAALGAWFGRPSAKCVAVMGDGSFGFVAGELETVRRVNAPLLMVVLSNGSYGWIKASQRASYGQRYYSVDFSKTDHAAIATAWGIKSFHVEDPGQLDTVLREAVAYPGPCLVDIVTQPLELAAAPVSQWMG